MDAIDPAASAWLLASTALGQVCVRRGREDGVDFTQHVETAHAEGVHGYQPSRRPASFGDHGAPAPRPETAEEG